MKPSNRILEVINMNTQYLTEFNGDDETIAFVNFYRKLIGIMYMYYYRDIASGNLPFYKWRYSINTDEYLEDLSDQILVKYDWIYIDMNYNFRYEFDNLSTSDDEQYISIDENLKNFLSSNIDMEYSEIEDKLYESEYDCVKDFNFIRLHNEKLSKILKYNKITPMNEDEDAILHSKLVSLDDILCMGFYGSILTEAYDDFSYYYLYDICMDEHGTIYDDVEPQRYFNPDVLFKLEEIDSYCNTLIEKYNI